MPQLDKYIFFHQMISFTFFFFLIYFYSRRVILPKLNGILKFRSKLRKILSFHSFKLEKKNLNAINFFSGKGVNFIQRSSVPIYALQNRLNSDLDKEIRSILTKISSFKHEDNNLSLFFLKKEILESKRNFTIK